MGELKDKASRYTAGFEGENPLGDLGNRTRKADKIQRVLDEAGAAKGDSARLLDIGCAQGLILRRLAAQVGFAVGIELDRLGMTADADNVGYLRADGECLPIRNDSLDVVICNHVYEHTEDPQQLLDEIARVLKPGGVCYFAGPNKYDLIEPHYRLPLLSWLPRWMADRYVRWTGRGDGYAERPLSPGNIRRMLTAFESRDYTGRMIGDPARYLMDDLLPPGSWRQRIAVFIHRWLPILFPGFVLILRKPDPD